MGPGCHRGHWAGQGQWGRSALAPRLPTEGFKVANAVILPLLEYLHISFNKTVFFKNKVPSGARPLGR